MCGCTHKVLVVKQLLLLSAPGIESLEGSSSQKSPKMIEEGEIGGNNPRKTEEDLLPLFLRFERNRIKESREKKTIHISFFKSIHTFLY